MAAAIPRQFPDLALLLADQTRTPIVSSAGVPEVEEDEEQDEGQQQQPGPRKPSRQQRAAALDDLAATALRARDAAARLGLGADRPVAADASSPRDGPADGGQPDPDQAAAALLVALGMTPPEHMVVTYSTGAVVIESFLDPQQRRPRRPQDARRPSYTPSTNTATGPAEPVDDGSAPLLVGVVAAPDVRALGAARRATAHLERVGRALQDQLAESQQ